MVQFEQRHINLLSHMDANLTAERDQVQLGCSLPVTYQPFKFDSRRFRIDWRLLHGVDIHKVVSSGHAGLSRHSIWVST